ncbi:Nif3-like dinuclear metal center hexameric protein [Shewanella maritima]|uniref:Nif3-like dinuclear metal center hexameric protein n=1 Tax=Shewanella maritima TaxID=2520507 RepID=UPI003736D163
MSRQQLCQYLDEYLSVGQFKDYAPNGLQVEGSDTINTIVTGVTACQPLIEQAIALNADAIVVHHGFFWKNEPDVITGMKHKRIKALITNDINLMGYHLPLDAHPEVGNNAQLAEKLGLVEVSVCDSVPQNLLWQGKLSVPMSPAQLAELLHNTLDKAPLHIGSDKTISSLAWCSGGAQDYIDMAVHLGVDAFISGEVSERTYHAAMEQDIHYFAAGHHATERFGVKALGQHLSDKFGITSHFVDIVNPV